MTTPLTTERIAELAKQAEKCIADRSPFHHTDARDLLDICDEVLSLRRQVAEGSMYGKTVTQLPPGYSASGDARLRELRERLKVRHEFMVFDACDKPSGDWVHVTSLESHIDELLAAAPEPQPAPTPPHPDALRKALRKVVADAKRITWDISEAVTGVAYRVEIDLPTWEAIQVALAAQPSPSVAAPQPGARDALREAAQEFDAWIRRELEDRGDRDCWWPGFAKHVDAMRSALAQAPAASEAKPDEIAKLREELAKTERRERDGVALFDGIVAELRTKLAAAEKELAEARAELAAVTKNRDEIKCGVLNKHWHCSGCARSFDKSDRVAFKAHTQKCVGSLQHEMAQEFAAELAAARATESDGAREAKIEAWEKKSRDWLTRVASIEVGGAKTLPLIAGVMLKEAVALMRATPPASPRQDAGAAVPIRDAVADIAVERAKQRAKWGDAHDDEHQDGMLAVVACEVAMTEDDRWRLVRRHKGDRRKQLVIAAALLAAEIDRLDRLSGNTPERAVEPGCTCRKHITHDLGMPCPIHGPVTHLRDDEIEEAQRAERAAEPKRDGAMEAKLDEAMGTVRNFRAGDVSHGFAILADAVLLLRDAMRREVK